jgi:hypothetical protein
MELLDKSFEVSADGNATISDLFVNGARECFLLEDRVRETPFHPPLSLEAWVASWKIKHKTAIPSGRFRVTYVWSPHFRCYVPLVEKVPGYDAIEIHWGNKAKDTDGCPITGRIHPARQDFVGESNIAWDALMPKLERAWAVKRVATDGRGKPIKYERVGPPEEIWLTIDRSALADPTSPTSSAG